MSILLHIFKNTSLKERFPNNLKEGYIAGLQSWGELFISWLLLWIFTTLTGRENRKEIYGVVKSLPVFDLKDKVMIWFELGVSLLVAWKYDKPRGSIQEGFGLAICGNATAVVFT